MTNVRTARIVRSGNALAVILPKDWTRGNDLEARDEIGMRYDGEVRIFILPKPKSTEPKELETVSA